MTLLCIKGRNCEEYFDNSMNNLVSGVRKIDNKGAISMFRIIKFFGNRTFIIYIYLILDLITR